MLSAILLSETGKVSKITVESIPEGAMKLLHFDVYGLPNVYAFTVSKENGVLASGPHGAKQNKLMNSLMSVEHNGAKCMVGKWALSRIDGQPLSVETVNSMIGVAIKYGQLYKYHAEFLFSRNPEHAKNGKRFLPDTDTEITRKIREAFESIEK